MTTPAQITGPLECALCCRPKTAIEVTPTRPETKFCLRICQSCAQDIAAEWASWARRCPPNFHSGKRKP